jgi:hypothetical protein
MHRTATRPRVDVTADGRGVVGHAGTRLLTDVADVTGLTRGFSDALAIAGRRAGGHDRGARAWIPALEADGGLRDGAEVVEITHLVDAAVLAPLPAGTRLIVRRERPHPGAQLDLFDTIEGLRHQVAATDTPVGRGSIQYLEARHRGHARVEDRIRAGKDTGFGRFPSRQFAINAAWLELALVGIDLLAWTRTLLLDGEHALAEPKRLRYQLLHVAARLVRTARRTYLRIAQRWPWAEALTTAFSRLNALPKPAT